MSPLIETIALWLADVHLLAGALLALGLPALMLLRQPAQRMAVAKSTLAALATLVVLCALPGWSLVHLLSADTRPAPPALTVTTPVVTPSPQSLNQYIPHINVDEIPIDSPPTFATSTLAPLERVRPSFSWPAALVTLQATGSAAVVLWLVAGAIMVHRVRRTSEPASPELQRLLAELSRAASPPSLLVSTRVGTPVALGLRCPAIILPQVLAIPGGAPQSSRGVVEVENCSADHHARRETLGVPPEAAADSGSRGDPASGGPVFAVTPVLAHELAHIAAGDLRTLAVARLLLVVFWPQPLFWLLRRRIRFDQESLADVAAAEVAGRVNYAEQLVGWAREVGPRGRAPRIAGAVGLWESPSQLKRRIALLLDEQLTILRTATRRWRVGTTCAALVAAALLSLVTLQRQEPAKVAAPATVKTPANLTDTTDTPADDTRSVQNDERARINGRIVLEDGSPAITEGELSYENEYANSNESAAGSEGRFKDSFTLRARRGTLTLKHFVDGYAPAWVGPLDIASGEEYDVVITLARGFAADVEVVAEDGSAVPDVQFYASPVINGSTSGNPNRPINVTGRFKLEHLASVPYQVHARAAGYQPLRWHEVDFEADRPLRLTMRKSQVLRGTIRDAKGAPAAKARVLSQAELHSRGVNQTSFTSADKPTAIAGDDGRFALDELADGVQYACIIETADKARLFVPDICAGDPGKDYVVPPRRDLHGVIRGELSGLAMRKGKPYVRVNQRIEAEPRAGIGRMSYSGMFGSEVAVTPTAGGGEFSYEGLLDGEVEITFGDDTQTFDVAPEGTTEVTLQLESPAAEAESARVTPPSDDDAAPEGSTVAPGQPLGTLQLVKQPEMADPPAADANSVFVRCLNEAGGPLAGAEVRLYRLQVREGKQELLGATTTDPDGEAAFTGILDASRLTEYAALMAVRGEYQPKMFANFLALAVRRADRATSQFGVMEYEVAARGYRTDVKLGPAQILSGRVTAPDGTAVTGAQVVAGAMSNLAIEGVNVTKTDAEGRYEFRDRQKFDAKAAREQAGQNTFFLAADDDLAARNAPPRPETGVDIAASTVTVTHPDFALTQVVGGDVPGAVDVVMNPAASIAGRVIHSDTGAPVANMLVRATGRAELALGPDNQIVGKTVDRLSVTPQAGSLTKAGFTPVGSTQSASARTDSDGRYLLKNVTAGVYDVWAAPSADDPSQAQLFNTGIPRLPVPAGDVPAAAADLIVGPGGLLRAQLIDGMTAKPLEIPGGARVTVFGEYLTGPNMQDRESPRVDLSPEGRFETRLAPSTLRATIFVHRKGDSSGQPVYLVSSDSYTRGPDISLEHGQIRDEQITVWPSAEIDRRRGQMHSAFELDYKGHSAEAIAALDTILAERPTEIAALVQRGRIHDKLRQDDLARADYEAVLKIDSREFNALASLSLLLASSSKDAVRDGRRAIELATIAANQARQAGWMEVVPSVLTTLAAAYAETGNFAKAIAIQQEALETTPADSRERVHQRIELYRAKKPYRRGAAAEPISPPAPATTPTDKQGSSTGGILDSLDPARTGAVGQAQIVERFSSDPPAVADGGVWRLVPEPAWGYGIDGGNQNARLR